MKNIKPYSKDSFAFYKDICRKKENQALKDRLTLMNDELETIYLDYDESFANNTLELIQPKGYIGQENIDLAELYNYKMIPFQNLRTELTTTESGRSVKCQNCTINDSNTFDHLIPQSEFIEYSVHPKNLICSCGDCNGRKNSIWRKDGKRTSLNLYLDQLPQNQYLFVELSIGNIRTEVTFYLDNSAGKVNVDMYDLIQSHYKKLDLCRRFSEGADTVITSFKNILSAFTTNPQDKSQQMQMIMDYLERERVAFGFNHWQTILKHALVNDPDFMIDFN